MDLERGLPTTPEDVLALRRLRHAVPLSTEDFLRWLAQLPSPTLEQLRARRGPRGEPFRLP